MVSRWCGRQRNSPWRRSDNRLITSIFLYRRAPASSSSRQSQKRPARYPEFPPLVAGESIFSHPSKIPTRTYPWVHAPARHRQTDAIIRTGAIRNSMKIPKGTAISVVLASLFLIGSHSEKTDSAAVSESIKPFLGSWDLTLKAPDREFPSWLE